MPSLSTDIYKAIANNAANQVIAAGEAVVDTVTSGASTIGNAVVTRLTNPNVHNNDFNTANEALNAGINATAAAAASAVKTAYDKSIAGLNVALDALIGEENLEIPHRDGTVTKERVGGALSLITETNIPLLQKTISTMEIPADASSIKKTLIKGANLLANAHTAVANKGDAASQVVATATYGIFHKIFTIALLPVSLFLPGRVVVESLSLLMAAIARGATLVATQAIGHGVLLATEATIAGLAIATGAVALVASFFAGPVLCVVVMKQQQQINELSKNQQQIVDVITKDQRIAGEKRAAQQAIINSSEISQSHGIEDVFTLAPAAPVRTAEQDLDVALNALNEMPIPVVTDADRNAATPVATSSIVTAAKTAVKATVLGIGSLATAYGLTQAMNAAFPYVSAAVANATPYVSAATNYATSLLPTFVNLA